MRNRRHEVLASLPGWPDMVTGAALATINQPCLRPRTTRCPDWSVTGSPPRPDRPAHRRPGPIISAEHGEVLSDAAGEVQRLEVVEFACGSVPQLL